MLVRPSHRREIGQRVPLTTRSYPARPTGAFDQVYAASGSEPKVERRNRAEQHHCFFGGKLLRHYRKLESESTPDIEVDGFSSSKPGSTAFLGGRDHRIQSVDNEVETLAMFQAAVETETMAGPDSR
jgi:hypothetical protein